MSEITQYEEKPYSNLLNIIDTVWTTARQRAAESVNTELLHANWETGKYIVEYEQNGSLRATYGKNLLLRLSKDLTLRHGKGFSRSNLTYMRKLYLAFPKSETLSHILTWSHYFELLKCEDKLEMQFYLREAERQRWNIRELKRQIQSSLFHRIAMSKDKEGILSLATNGHQIMTPDDIMKDPFVLEFTGIKQESHILEHDIETALLNNMEQFLLELGRGFAFVGRQYPLQIGSRRFKVDLVFYNCILKCYVLIDLKRDEIEHGDIGQMNLYLNYFKKEVNQHDDNPPIGIVLGTKKDELLMEYALEGITTQLFVGRYQLYLPKREELQSQLNLLLTQSENKN